jgi:voltage-gated potassium channel
MRRRTVLVGFGVTGASAARQLLRTGTAADDVMVVDNRPEAVADAQELGLPAVLGDGTERAVLDRATGGRAGHVIVTAGPDTVAVMATMLARDLCPDVVVVTAIRDAEYVRYALRVGANDVIATSQWTGRALALVLDLAGPPRPLNR